MRTLLNTIYRASGALSAAFLALTAAVVAVQVVFNLIGVAADRLFGLEVSLVIPSYADFAGYFFAASAFLGLGYAHHAGAHIRVSILMDRAPRRLRTFLQTWCLAVAVFLAGTLTVHAVAMVEESFLYNDLSVGLVAVPLWIPQSAMAIGAVVVTIALADDLVCALWSMVVGSRVEVRAFDPLLEAPAAADHRSLPVPSAAPMVDAGGLKPVIPRTELA